MEGLVNPASKFAELTRRCDDPLATLGPILSHFAA